MVSAANQQTFKQNNADVTGANPTAIAELGFQLAGKDLTEEFAVDPFAALEPLSNVFAAVAPGEETSNQTGFTLDEEREKRVDARLADNTVLMAGDNLEGINKRGGALSQHNEREAKRLVEQRKASSDIVAYLLDHIEQLEAQLAESNARLGVLSIYEESLRGALDDIANGTHELDENGELKDKSAEAAVKEYEDKYGVKIDRSDAEQLRSILEDVRAEQAELKRDNESLQHERDRALEIQGRLEAGDPAAIQQITKSYAESNSNKRDINKAITEIDSKELQDAAKRDVLSSRDDQEYATSDPSTDLFSFDMVTLGSENKVAKGGVSLSFKEASAVKGGLDIENGPSEQLENKGYGPGGPETFTV